MTIADTGSDTSSTECTPSFHCCKCYCLVSKYIIPLFTKCGKQTKLICKPTNSSDSTIAASTDNTIPCHVSPGNLQPLLTVVQNFAKSQAQFEPKLVNDDINIINPEKKVTVKCTFYMMWNQTMLPTLHNKGRKY